MQTKPAFPPIATPTLLARLGLAAGLAVLASPSVAAPQLESAYAYFATVRDFDEFEPGLGFTSRSSSYSDIGGCEGNDETGGGRCGGYENSSWTLTLTDNSLNYAASLRQNQALAGMAPNTQIQISTVFGADREMRLKEREVRSVHTAFCGGCSNNLWSNVTQFQGPDGRWHVTVDLLTSAATTEAIQQIDHSFALTLTEVPEPQGWMMMAAGFGLLGFASRYRRRRPRALATA